MAACVLLVALVGVGCSSPEIEPGESSPPIPHAANLILISIDTLRADRLGAYGYARPTSPALDALSARGVRFATVIAESSWTRPSHMTLFTGLPPSAHGVTKLGHLPESIPTLAEVVARHGFRTFAYTGGGHVKGRIGFARGFEVYDDEPWKGFGRSLDLARQQIEALAPGERYFVFVHDYLVHCPYDPPPAYAARFQTRPPEDHVATAGRCDRDFDAAALTEGQARFLSDRYDASIRQADDGLAGFVDFLDARGELDDTLLVVTSDHGEAFLEHGHLGHRGRLDIELLRVPLIAVGAGLAPRVVDEPVGLVDLTPTVLDGLEVEAPEMQGRSRWAQMSGLPGAAPSAPRFSELDYKARLRSVVDRDHQLIWNLQTGDKQIFDLRRDPHAQSPLGAERSEIGAHLDEALSAYVNGHSTSRNARPARARRDEIEELRSLGYVEDE